MRLLRLLLAVVAIALVVVGLYGFGEALSDPVVRSATLPMVGVDRRTPPLRIALVSDIHVGNLAMPVWRLNRVVDQINAQHADVVLLAGDFVNGVGTRSRDFHPWLLVGPLSRLKAPLGVHAVLGNHDLNSAQPYVDFALRQAGIDVLHDRVIRIGPIALIGMDMEHTDQAQIAPLLAQARATGLYPVLMTHGPPYHDQIQPDIPLVLAGHTHCGQIVFPGWDNGYDIAHGTRRFDPALRCGIAHIGAQVVVVTGGVGATTLPPIRIGAPPDFWVLTLVGQPR